MRFVVIALAALALALLGAATGWSYRVPLLGWAATRLIERQGFGPARLTVDAVDLHGLHMHDVLLRNGAVRISEVSASYDPLDLLRAGLRQVELTDLEVALVAGRDGIELGGIPLVRTAASGGDSPLSGWRVDALALPRARISLEGASGPVNATFSATLAVARLEIHSTDFLATITGPVGGASRSASITAQELAWQAETAGITRVVIKRAAVMSEDLPWSAQAIDGDVVWHSDRSSVHLEIGQVLNRQQPMLIAPFSLAADASLAAQLLEVTAGATFGGKAAAKLEAKVRHDRPSGSGSASIVLGPVLFQQGSLQPADLFPAFGDMVKDVDGTVAIEGSVRWSGDSLSPDFRLQFKDLAFAGSAAQFRGVKGEIRFTKLWPLATAPSQTLAGTIEAAGLPPAAFRLKGQLTARTAVKLEQAVVDVAGGQIMATPFTIDPAARQLDTALTIDRVDLSEITKLLGLQGLSGTGQLSGQIPLRVKNDTIVISAGKLAAQGPGLMRYKPDKLPDEIAGAGKSVELMLEALTDFHYETLALEIEKRATGEGTILLHLNGNNPAVMAGRPFAFNIGLESNFDRLADYALLALSSAQDVLRRAAGRTGP
jgi:dicarboxylate transporter DctA-like protein